MSHGRGGERGRLAESGRRRSRRMAGRTDTRSAAAW